MQRLRGKQILLGITGGIAAYKSAELTRGLKKAGAQVRVVMTAAAREFITPLTLQALSGHPVHTDLLDPAAEAAMGHIELARWADLVLIAPASADFLARLAQGQGDDLLATLCLATRAPIAVAPAMNQAMWQAASTQHNIALLRGRNVAIWGPAEGEQACGESGPGRMIEVDELLRSAAESFESGLLTGLKVVVTAGPTREAIDPVRYISNHSSGKMGYALASAAAEAGAEVVLISGPTMLATPEGVRRVDVTTACQMLDATLAELDGCALFIATAAVADYRPQQAAMQKIKKRQGEESLTLTLVRNPDIVATVDRQTPRPFTVGFAAENEQLLAHARAKLIDKKLDLVIANDVSDSRIGFNSDQNQVTLVSAAGELELPCLAKGRLAHELIGHIHRLYQTRPQ